MALFSPKAEEQVVTELSRLNDNLELVMSHFKIRRLDPDLGRITLSETPSELEQAIREYKILNNLESPDEEVDD